MRPLLHASLVNDRYGDPAVYVETLFEKHARRCQSKILDTWSGHRTAQINPEKCRKSNGREIRF